MNCIEKQRRALKINERESFENIFIDILFYPKKITGSKTDFL